MSNTTENKNVIITNVTLNWAKLDKPVSPFGVDQYELQIQGPLKRMKEFSQFGKVKDTGDGFVSVNLKKKAEKRDGSAAAKVRVVDANKKPLDPSTIGNGSKGNVIVLQNDYEIKGPNGKVTKSGTSTMLTAVQVTELKIYERKNMVDFDNVGDEGVDTPQDDDIMF
jgi:hypothetical protein